MRPSPDGSLFPLLFHSFDFRVAIADRTPFPTMIAVGTLIAKRPPHRSEHAQLRHSAPTLGV